MERIKKPVKLAESYPRVTGKLKNKTYIAPAWAVNGMVETIVPALLRPVPAIEFETEIFELPDGDMIPLNWFSRDNEKLAVIVPGLESNSTRSYIRNISRYLSISGFDVLVTDHRGCMLPNKLFRSYHSGNSGDLKAVIESKQVQKYLWVYLIGFSLGGNIVLKYLGENPENGHLKKAASVCAPYDLLSCSRELELRKNRIFRDRFVRSLKKSLLLKADSYPGRIEHSAIRSCKTLWDVDDLYTAPVHGFKNAEDYYIRCSSKNFLIHIAIPTLLINAKNDPLIPLDDDSLQQLGSNENLLPLITERGGHMGYPNRWLSGANFYEKSILEFFVE